MQHLVTLNSSDFLFFFAMNKGFQTTSSYLIKVFCGSKCDLEFPCVGFQRLRVALRNFPPCRNRHLEYSSSLFHSNSAEFTLVKIFPINECEIRSEKLQQAILVMLFVSCTRDLVQSFYDITERSVCLVSLFCFLLFFSFSLV